VLSSVGQKEKGGSQEENESKGKTGGQVKNVLGKGEHAGSKVCNR